MIDPERAGHRAYAPRFVLALAILAALVSLLGCTPFRDASSSVASNERSPKDGGASGADTAAAARRSDASSEDNAGDAAVGLGAMSGTRRNTSGSTASGTGGSHTAAAGADAMSGTGGGNASGDAPPRTAAGSGGGAETPLDEPPRDRTPLDPTQVALDPETADAESLRLLSEWAKLPIFATGKYQQQTSHDRGKVDATEASLLPVTAHGNRDFNNFICKSADADTGSGAVVSYEYDTASCSDSYVRGVVLARYEGSGRMTRFWVTSDSLYVPAGTFSDEIVRVYVDDNPRAMLQLPLEQVLSGAAGEIFTIPFGVVSKTYVAWHYPVVFSRKLVVALDRLRAQYFYQVDAVLDSQPQRRVAPRQRLSQRDAAHALLAGASPIPPAASSLRAEMLALGAGDERVLQLTGPANIEELRLRVAKDKLADLAGVRVAVSWDGAGQPAIDVALLDFFAASQAAAASSSLALSASIEADTQVLSLRLPMPFRTSATWTLKNAGSAAVDFQLDWVGEKTVPDAMFGHLHVQRNQVQLPATQLEQTIAEVHGRGRFVGVCADLAGHQDRSLTGVSTNLDMLQGDFRATADGQRVLDSTGTEDYADSSFYFRDSPKATPFAQNWGRVDDASAQPPGRVSFCRWQVLGSEIDFQQELKITRELAQYDTSVAELQRTVVYLYLP